MALDTEAYPSDLAGSGNLIIPSTACGSDARPLELFGLSMGCENLHNYLRVSFEAAFDTIRFGI